MSPVFQKDNGKWYFEFSMVEFGPYETDTDAWDEYESVVASAKSCKNCED